MRKKLKLVLTVATLEAGNAYEAVVAPMVRSDGVCVWGESGVSRLVFVCAFVRNLASVAVKKFYKFCTSNVI
jgi:hypothetical protein